MVDTAAAAVAVAPKVKAAAGAAGTGEAAVPKRAADSEAAADTKGVAIVVEEASKAVEENTWAVDHVEVTPGRRSLGEQSLFVVRHVR